MIETMVGKERFLCNGLLALFLLADLAYSFWQFGQLPLDGDLAWLVAPTPHYTPVLRDPLAVGLWSDPTPYASPNRFFAHWSVKAYFDHVPLWLQAFLDPISSLYAAAALAKTLIQAALIGLLAISAAPRLRGLSWLPAAVLITPFFQTNGYYTIGIIDHAVSYVFFYALPMVLLLAYGLPWLRSWRRHGHFRLPGYQQVLLAALAVVIAFHGALGAPVLILANLGLVSWELGHRPKIRKALRRLPWPLIGWAVGLGLYSLFIGRYSTENPADPPALMQRYGLLPQGLWQMLTEKLGLPVLIGGLVALYAAALCTGDARSTRRLFTFVLLLVLLYLLLLPLGGYRPYRPLIIRRDTFMPVTLALVFLYAHTALGLLNRRRSPWLLAGLVAVGLFFNLADGPGKGRNECERRGLHQLAEADASPQRLPADCTVLSWSLIRRPEDSEYQARMLQRWGITKRGIRYFQE
jgi:hypothetical protein